jgi:asparagine synthase (glutamine-hydrolysing)
MCGIAGIIGRWPGEDLRRFRDRTYGLLRHRGPDGRGASALHADGLRMCNEGDVSPEATGILLHTRLAILDLSSTGAQPMIEEGGRRGLVFNGEIYNYREIVPGRPDRKPRGSSDTEALFLWLDRDEEPLYERLIGMFAFANVDYTRGQFTLVRDAFGIKPLYFVRRPGAVAFASEIPVLLALPGVRRRCDPTKLVDALRFGVSFPRETSIFAGLEELSPGELLEGRLGDPGSARRRRWYHLPEGGKGGFRGGFTEAVEALRSTFRESVRIHLRSDVPLGFALSGGVDSSSIALMASSLLGGSGENRCISFVAQTAALSEENWIEMAARAGGLRVDKVRSAECRLPDDIDEYVEAHDEPVAGTSAYAEFSVYRRARERGLKVMLDGQGPDEMMAGYPYYLSTYAHQLIRRGRVLKAWRLLGTPHARAKASPIRYLKQAIVPFVPPALQAGVRRLAGGEPAMAPWLRFEGLEGEIGASLAENRAAVMGGLRQHLLLSVKQGLANQLRQTDRNSMRFSIENRVPFITIPMLELALSFPDEFLFGPEGQTKHVLREAMRGTVPDPILDRGDKIGFANDEAAQLVECADWIESVLTESGGDCPYVDAARLRSEWQAARSGAAVSVQRIWAALLFLRWWKLNRVET